MQGKIIKGIAGFYYVHVADCGVYECMAKGIFRNKSVKPLVGDLVELEDVTDTDIERKGNIIEILPRKNELIRPAVANIDQTLIVFAAKSPVPNLVVLSKFLVMMEQKNIPTIICFNKQDQVSEEESERLAAIFAGSGCRVIRTCTYTGEGIEELRELMEGKTTALAGPSGVGKSSLLNALYPEADSKTGSISEKLHKGKNTTRHTEIFQISDHGNTYLMDTPGFTSFEAMETPAEELRFYFPELREYEGQCRFDGCLHLKEPDCAVKKAVQDGLISPKRYEIYNAMMEELKDKRKY